MESRQSCPPFNVRRETTHSNRHPIIPRLCVQEWKKDMVNRKLILENADLGCVPCYEHDDALYLDKAEQLHYNVEDRDRVESRYRLPSRDEMRRPPMHHPTARHRSSMCYWKASAEADAEDGADVDRMRSSAGRAGQRSAELLRH